MNAQSREFWSDPARAHEAGLGFNLPKDQLDDLHRAVWRQAKESEKSARGRTNRKSAKQPRPLRTPPWLTYVIKRMRKARPSGSTLDAFLTQMSSEDPTTNGLRLTWQPMRKRFSIECQGAPRNT
jgi:hypothetical protein